MNGVALWSDSLSICGDACMRSVSGAGDFQFALSLREVIWGVIFFLKGSVVCRCDDKGTCRDHEGGGHHEVFNILYSYR